MKTVRKHMKTDAKASVNAGFSYGRQEIIKFSVWGPPGRHFGGVWEPLGGLLGSPGGLLGASWAFLGASWAPLGDARGRKITFLKRVPRKTRSKVDLGGFGEGFARVWGGFWEGLGRGLEAS